MRAEVVRPLWKHNKCWIWLTFRGKATNTQKRLMYKLDFKSESTFSLERYSDRLFSMFIRALFRCNFAVANNKLCKLLFNARAIPFAIITGKKPNEYALNYKFLCAICASSFFCSLLWNFKSTFATHLYTLRRQRERAPNFVQPTRQRLAADGVSSFFRMSMAKPLVLPAERTASNYSSATPLQTFASAPPLPTPAVTIINKHKMARRLRSLLLLVLRP